MHDAASAPIEDGPPTDLDDAPLDHALLEAHTQGDVPALIDLYTQAADAAAAQANADAAAFYLTHAFVFALELGAPAADPLNKRLADMGRADRLTF